MRVPVSERAVLQRVNRKLAHEREAIRKWRSAGYQSGVNWEPGDYYHVDFNRNMMLDYRVDLEQLARELGVLGAGEHLQETEHV